MTSRRTFLRNLVAAIVLAPVVAKFAEALPDPLAGAVHFKWLTDPDPARFEFRDGQYVRFVHPDFSHPGFGYAVLIKRS